MQHPKNPKLSASGRLLATIHDDAGNFYDILDALGNGQFGEVFQAAHKVTGAVVAVKFINRKVTGANVDSITAQEIEVMLRIDHPNCVKLYEIYQTDTEIQLVMELLEGGDLFDRIQTHKKFPEEQARLMMMQICTGIKYLHDQKIIHRDLKPENILLLHAQDADVTGPEKWEVKVADFGRSKLFPQEAPDMHTRTRCGTPGYAAPEVLLRQEYGEKIDCWGCGILAFIMLSGRPPFPLNMASASQQKVTSAQYKFRFQHWSLVSEEAKDFIRRMLVPYPDRRMSMGDALKHPWLTGVPAPSRDSASTQVSAKDGRTADTAPRLAAGSGSGLEFSTDTPETNSTQRANSALKDGKNLACCVIA